MFRMYACVDCRYKFMITKLKKKKNVKWNRKKSWSEKWTLSHWFFFCSWKRILHMNKLQLDPHSMRRNRSAIFIFIFSHFVIFFFYSTSSFCIVIQWSSTVIFFYLFMLYFSFLCDFVSFSSSKFIEPQQSVNLVCPFFLKRSSWTSFHFLYVTYSIFFNLKLETQISFPFFKENFLCFHFSWHKKCFLCLSLSPIT